MTPSTEPDLISETEEILFIKELQEYINSPEASTNPQIRVITKLQKQIYKLILDSWNMKKRIEILEDHIGKTRKHDL